MYSIVVGLIIFFAILLILVIPFIQTIVRGDMRVIVMDIPPQDVISKDNISRSDQAKG